MLFVKLTRGDARSFLAGPYKDPIDANYQCKQLALADSNPESRYEVVEADWVVTVEREGSNGPEVISWHETEDDAKNVAGFTQRSDYSIIAKAAKWPLT